MDYLRWTLTLLILAMPLPTLAQLYKWTDEHGKVHFSDHPHQSGDQPIELRNTIGSKNPVPTEAPQHIDRDHLLKEFEYDRQKKAEKKAQKAAERAKRKRYCAQLDRQRKAYNKYSHLVEVDGNGHRTYLDKDAEIAKLDQLYRQYCR